MISGWQRLAAVCLLLSGCGSEKADPRFATPEATLQSLLRAYGVENVPEREVQRHLRARGNFALRDEALYRACFMDFRGPADEGAAGFVFGTLVARKDSWRITHMDDRAHVFTDPEQRPDHMIVLVRTLDGYKISLERSVPPLVRQRLRDVYEHALSAAKKAR